MTKLQTKQDIQKECEALREQLRKRNELLLSLTEYFKLIENHIQSVLKSIQEVTAWHKELTIKMENSNDNTGV